MAGQAAVNAAGAGIAGSFVSSGFSSAAGDFAGASANNAMKDMSNAAINTPAGVDSTIANTTKPLVELLWLPMHYSLLHRRLARWEILSAQ
jgi:hypothetical protein